MEKIKPRILLGAGVVYGLLYWWRLTLTGSLPLDGNALRLFYPTWIIGKTLFFNDFSFLWDPFRNCGQPFLADPQNQALYPLRFIGLFTSYASYVKLFIGFHVFLLALFGYKLGQKQFKNKNLGWLVALGLAFNGFVLARVTLMSHFASLAWVPCIVFTFFEKRPLLLGLALAFQWLAGFPPFSLLTGVLLLILTLLDPKKSNFLLLFRGGLLSLGLTAIQWLPFLEMLDNAVRPVLLSPLGAVSNSLHPLDLIKHLLVPPILVSLLKPASLSDPAVSHFYFGPFFLILFIIGIRKGSTYDKWLGSIFVLSLLLSLGEYNKIYSRLPLLHIFRFPGNWILIGLVPFVLVATKGYSQLTSHKLRISLGILVLVDLLFYALLPHTTWVKESFFTTTQQAEELQPIPKGTRIFHSYKLTDKAHQWIIHNKQEWKTLKTFLHPSIGPGVGIGEVASYHNLTSKRHFDFLIRLNHEPPESRLFDLARVSKIITLKADKPAETLPPVDEIRVIDNNNAFDSVYHSENKPITGIKETATRVHFETEGPGHAVLSTAFNTGWRVKINGKPSILHSFENEFLATPLSEGPQSVQFEYKPRSFQIGRAVSFFFLLFIGYKLGITIKKLKTTVS